VDEDQQLLIESACGDSLLNVPLPDVPLPNVPLPDVPFPKACPQGSVGDGLTSPQVAEEAMVVAFGLGSGSCLVHFLCSNRFISGIVYYIRREVFGSLKVYFIYGFCIGFIVLVSFYS